MPLIQSLANDGTQNKMFNSLNGVSTFEVGPFYAQYGTGITTQASTTTEWSILFNIASNSSSKSTLTIPTASAAISAINLADDPTGKSPGASLYLPGTSQLNVPTGPFGALMLGSMISGEFWGVVGITSTPTIEWKMYLRKPSDGSVAYTLADSSTGFAPAAGGLFLKPMLAVSAVGTKGSITASFMAIGGTSAYVMTPTVTTVDTTQSYILDITGTWSASSASNTYTFYHGGREYLF